MKISVSLVLLVTIISISSCTRDFVCECSIIESDGINTYTHSTYENVRGTRFNLDDECPKEDYDWDNGNTIVKRCGLQ